MYGISKPIALRLCHRCEKRPIASRGRAKKERRCMVCQRQVELRRQKKKARARLKHATRRMGRR